MAIEGATSFSVMGSFDMLSKVNYIAQQFGIDQGPFFKPSLISIKDKLVKSSSGHPFYTDNAIEDDVLYDLILLPSCDGDIFETIENNQSLSPWLIDQHERGATLASMCTGSFLMAATGLLDDKTVTSHWAYQRQFEARFPKTVFKPNSTIIDHQSLIMAGGGTSFPHLILYLIEKFYGHELAVICSKFMVVDMESIPQSIFSIFTAHKQHADSEMLVIQEYIEQNYSATISIDILADKAAMTGRTLIRRFKNATGLTPIDYLQMVRIESAKKRIEQGNTPLKEITIAVGYSDFSNFNKLFKKHVGISMKEYERKFAKLVAAP